MSEEKSATKAKLTSREEFRFLTDLVLKHSTGEHTFVAVGYAPGEIMLLDAWSGEVKRARAAAFDASFLVCTLTLLAAGGIYSFTKEKKF